MLYKNIPRLVKYLKYNWIPIILIILSIYDLRIDIRLLLDSEHPLAITVIFTMSRLLKSLN